MSIYDAFSKVKDYIKEQNSDYKKDIEATYVTKQVLLDAEKYYNRVKDCVLHKPLADSKRVHKTIIKKTTELCVELQ